MSAPSGRRLHWRRMTKTCAAQLNPSCDRPAYCRGLCQGHYRQQVRGGPLSQLQERAPEGERPQGTPVTVVLDDALVAALDAAAEAAGTNRSQVAREVLTRWAARRKT